MNETSSKLLWVWVVPHPIPYLGLCPTLQLLYWLLIVHRLFPNLENPPRPHGSQWLRALWTQEASPLLVVKIVLQRSPWD